MGLSIVTGASRGIGLELCRQLKARGADVLAVCRSVTGDLDALGVNVEAGVEVTDGARIAALAQKLKGAPVDLLVNNAGIGDFGGLDAVDFDSVEQQFEVNAMGPLRVTLALLPNLRRGSKVAIITSRMGSIADNGSGGYYGYRMSKAAVNAAGVSLAHDLKEKGIAVALLHPGMVSTDMTGNRGVPPAEAVKGILARIDALSPETSGRFLHAGTGEELPW